MSNKKNIIIRTDSSSQIGLGHLKRTLLLAEGLKHHFCITFFVQDLLGNQNHLIIEKGFTIQTLHTSSCMEFQKNLSGFNPVLCIIDHYEIDMACENSIRSICPLMVFDDEFKTHAADVVLNHSFIALQKDYDHLRNTNILAGSFYTLLHPDFFSTKNKYTPIKSFKHKKILVTLGGSDVMNLSWTIKKNLLSFEKSCQVDIVTTSANPNSSKLKLLYPSTIINEKRMAFRLGEYDLIITSASTSLIETIALKKPFIAIQCAANQQKTVDILKNKGMANIISSYTPAALKKALLSVQYQSNKIKRTLEQYHFTQNKAAQEIINAYS